MQIQAEGVREHTFAVLRGEDQVDVDFGEGLGHGNTSGAPSGRIFMAMDTQGIGLGGLSLGLESGDPLGRRSRDAHRPLTMAIMAMDTQGIGLGGLSPGLESGGPLGRAGHGRAVCLLKPESGRWTGERGKPKAQESLKGHQIPARG